MAAEVEQVMKAVGRDEMAAVLAVAAEAGREIMAIYADEARWQVRDKADDSPVTAADLAAHAVIERGLRALPWPWLAALPVLSEESPPAQLSGRRSWPACWLVDPLDGTREFIARNGEFSVNIALVLGDEAVLGVVLSPVDGSAYVAARDQGSFRVSGGDWALLHVSLLPADGSPLRLTVSRRHGLEQLAAFEQAVAARLGPVERHPAGSAFKICAVAEGRADAYPRFGPTSEWDTAAAQVVLEEAGGHLLDARGRRFRYNRRDTLLNAGFLAVGAEPVQWLACWPA